MNQPINLSIRGLMKMGIDITDVGLPIEVIVRGKENGKGGRNHKKRYGV